MPKSKSLLQQRIVNRKNMRQIGRYARKRVNMPHAMPTCMHKDVEDLINSMQKDEEEASKVGIRFSELVEFTNKVLFAIGTIKSPEQRTNCALHLLSAMARRARDKEIVNSNLYRAYVYALRHRIHYSSKERPYDWSLDDIMNELVEKKNYKYVHSINVLMKRIRLPMFNSIYGPYVGLSL